MRRLARWLLVLALPCGSMVTAATAGGSSAKKRTSKTAEKPPAKAKPKTPPKSEDAEDGSASDEEKSPTNKPAKSLPEKKPASEGGSPEKESQTAKASPEASAEWLRRRAEAAGDPAPAPDPDAKGPAPKSSSKAESKGADDETAGPKKAGKGTAKESGEATADKQNPERVTQDTAAKTGTKGKSSSEEGEAEPTAESNVASKTKNKAKAEAKPILDKAGDPVVERSKQTGANATIAPEEVEDFATNSEGVQKLLRLGLALTERDLTYRYGSADPDSGGMDCSGTVYYLLRAAGLKDVPRDSSGLYVWARKAGTLHTVNAASLEDAQFAELRPGDMLFWEGTYGVQRDPPISHTMIYLGREKKTGARVMVGASDGRSYRGVRRNGVSVFDFKLPKAESTARFVGYARVPGLE